MKVLLAAWLQSVRRLNLASGAVREVARGAQEVSMELVTVDKGANVPRLRQSKNMTSFSPSSIRWICRGAAALVAVVVGDAVNGSDLLVADRLSNGVYRYSESGELLGTVLKDESAEYLNQPTGIALSPDSTRLYVSSSQNARVVRYDYNAFIGTASNPTIFADASDGLAFPNDIQFSPDGGKIYVANLEGGVSQFHADGSSAGPKLSMPPPPEGGLFQTSSMQFLPTGELLVGAFQDFPGGTLGGVAISNDDVSALADFLVEPTAVVNGATGLMIHEGYLYLTGLFSFNIRRFALSDGQIDPAWGISEIFFPQDLIEAPDGEGFLAGILGFSNGTGNISRYGFDGTFLDIFASPSEEGFIEATAFVAVPEPLLGDFNRDGTVDAADYTVWRDRFGTNVVLPNDDTPGTVDFSDHVAWRENFGAVLSAGGGASSEVVPEPGSILFALLASACYYATYRTPSAKITVNQGRRRAA